MAAIFRHGMPLFAYGTLMFPPVIRSVVGRVPEGQAGVIKGYRRLVVTGELFPGLLKENGDSDECVEGLVYRNITREEWKRLVAFEDEFYEVEEVAVDCSGRIIRALAFVVPPSRKFLLSEKVWSPDEFRDAVLGKLPSQL